MSVPEPPHPYAKIVRLIQATPAATRPHLIAALRKFLHDDEHSPDADMIHLSTMYGAATRTPYVQISWGAEMAQMSVEDARAHAVRIIEVAANAEADAAFIRFMRERLDLDSMEQVAAILLDFRAMRS
jgi:hypothetical protein